MENPQKDINKSKNQAVQEGKEAPAFAKDNSQASMCRSDIDTPIESDSLSSEDDEEEEKLPVHVNIQNEVLFKPA